MSSTRPLEKDVQRFILEYLSTQDHLYFWRSNNIPVFGRNNAGNMVHRALPKFTPRGLPDIIIVCRGKFVALEVKRLGAAMRPEQITFRDNITAHGGSYYVVYSVNDVKQISELQLYA